MPTFDVEVVHEPTGTYMNFQAEFEDEDDVNEDNVWNYILDELSIVAEEVK